MQTKVTLTALALATVMAALPAADAQAQNSRAILENSGKVEVQKRTSRGSSTKIIRVPGADPKAQKNRSILEKHGERSLLKSSKLPTPEALGMKLTKGIEHKPLSQSAFLPDLVPDNPGYTSDGFASICVHNIGTAPSKPEKVSLSVISDGIPDFKIIVWPALDPGDHHCFGTKLYNKYKKKINLLALVHYGNQPELDIGNNMRSFKITKGFVAPPKFGWKN